MHVRQLVDIHSVHYKLVMFIHTYVACTLHAYSTISTSCSLYIHIITMFGIIRYSALLTYDINDQVKILWSLGFWLISFVWCITCCYKYIPWSPHDGVFVECIDINTIESEVVQLLKGRDKWKLIFKLLNCLFTVYSV